MIRSVWVAVVSFAVILGLFWYCDSACRRMSEELVQGCREAEEMIRAGQHTRALKLLKGMEEEWVQKADYFSFFVDHQRTERIEENLRMVCIALEQEQEFDLYSSLSLLEAASESLYEAEAFVLKNIW